MPTKDNEKARNSLLKSYRKLSSSEMWLCQLLSVIYEPVQLQNLHRCTGRLGRKNAEIAEIIDSLVKAELVIRENDGFVCNRLICEQLTRSTLSSGGLHTFAGAVRDTIWRGSGWSEKEMRTPVSALARLRLAFYQRNASSFYEMLEHYSRLFPEAAANEPPLYTICNPPDKQWLLSLPSRMLLDSLLALVNGALRKIQPANDAFNLLKEFATKHENSTAPAFCLFPHWIYRGRPAASRKLLKNIPGTEGNPLRAWVEFISGKFELSCSLFKNCAVDKNLPPLLGVFASLVYLHQGEEDEAEFLVDRQLDKKDNSYREAYQSLRWLCRRRSGIVDARLDDISDDAHPLSKIIYWLVRYWEGGEGLEEEIPAMEEFFESCRKAGYLWLAAECAEILARVNDTEMEWAGKLANIRKKCKSYALAEMFHPRPPWERPLEALAILPQEIELSNGYAGEARLAWSVAFSDALGMCELHPLEQKLSAGGYWSKGRRISLQKLFEENDHLQYLSDQDKQICSAISPVTAGIGRGSKIHYELDYDRALPALAGHPLVFIDGTENVRLEVALGEPELHALKRSGSLEIRLEPEIEPGNSVSISRETPTRLRVIKISPAHQRITEILGKNGLLIPGEEVKNAVGIIEKLSHLVTVQSDLGIGMAGSEEVIADSRARVQLMPVGNGLRMEILYRPFGEEGGYYRPGVGAKTLLTSVSGKKLRTSRNLTKEKDDADEIERTCKSLVNCENREGVWQLEDAVDCLELLLELQNFGDKVVIEWPQGGDMKVRSQVSLSSLGVKIKQSNDWFTLDAKVEVDNDLVLDMQRLLEMSRSSTGRFLPVGDNKYIALTEEFKKRVEELAAYTEVKDGEVRVNSLAALALEDLASGAGTFEADIEWRKLIGKLKTPEDFELPSTLQAELRPYQHDGVRWLANLAQWRMGACLADDMGLGKTVQGLTVLLDRAKKGPALVVAPTSVCFNWIKEAARFAPSLKVVQFGDGDRQKAIEEAGKFTLLVSSYAMLQQEAEMFAQKKWHTVILDEAQAIKNAATKRSKAAMDLKADFRIVTTGTPLENHLGELWNIFRFLNPGLLGGLKRFNENFAIPIEKDDNQEAKERLKKLLRPFILRRTKTEVLEELPSRTEIVKYIEMSEEEIAFYQALRLRALDGLEQADGTGGQKRLQILAEIMRLRRACCNPKLVTEDSDIESSKLNEFKEIAVELIENNHKALVFSQFVGHLEILRNSLDELGIKYQYLDGSTPAKKRQALVEAFQGGEGDFFLISLKAGGQGLNLTAADYVIHMDPWWNPAVEDQASDRAHRIGQKRPVTIYRMVARGTIEEKILDLHKHKRDLADGLLTGASAGGKMSAEDLLSLIREDTRDL